MSKYGRLTETQIADAVLRVLATLEGGEASIAYLKHELPKYLDLSDADRAPSLTRQGEELWEQQVLNLVSHRGASGTAVHEGYLSYKPGRLAITTVGRDRLS